MIELDIWGRLIEMDEINLFWWDGYCLLSLWATPTIYFYIINIYITYVFLNIYIYLYISLLFIIYIRMYILQKKYKPKHRPTNQVHTKI